MILIPKISVVTLSYNQGEFLENTIKSVLEQEYPNLEYIIMDGGSTDNSVEVIRKYEKHLDYWQSQPDGGQSAAITAGFSRATGDIFCWLNSDDQFLPGALKKVGEYFSEHRECQWLTGQGIAITENNKEVRMPVEMNAKHYLFEFWMWGRKGGCFMFQPSTFWRCQLWTQSGGYCREDKPNSMDYELWLRFNQFTKPVIIPEILSVAKLHDACKSVANSHTQKYETIQSAKEYAKQKGVNLSLLFLINWERLHWHNLIKSTKKFDLRNIIKYCIYLSFVPLGLWSDNMCVYIWKRFFRYEDLKFNNKKQQKS